MPLLLGNLSVPGRIRACTFQHSIEDGAADGDLRLLGAERACPQPAADDRFVPTDRGLDGDRFP